jgi:hypothetical protein
VVQLSHDQPYLSVVVASRNDMHGGDPLARLQALVNSFSAQCLRFGLDAELIVVEWNPPADRPRLRDVVHAPERRALTLRFVEVPPELHATLPSADALPLFQMIAKNVGIRRARGQFVLSTNIDIIFSNDLVEYLGARRLQPGRLYRVDRHDIDNALPPDASLDEQMGYCTTHQRRLHAREGTYAVDRFGRRALTDHDVVDAPSVTIGKGWHVREGDADQGFYRWATREAHLHVDRTGVDAMRSGVVLELDVAPNPHEPAAWVDLEVMDRDVPLARRRVDVVAAPHARFCVALEDGVEHHDIVLRVRDTSGTDRRHQPLFELREGLAYRLLGARLRVIPRDAGLAFNHVATGPLQPKATGTYYFVVRPAAADQDVTFRVLDAPAGEPQPAQIYEVYDRGERIVMVSVDLRRGDLVWLDISGNRSGLYGSVPPQEFQPAFTSRALVAWMRVGVRRLRRSVRHAERRLRMSMAAWLREMLRRYDPSPERPVFDDSSSKAAEMVEIRDFLRTNRPPYLHMNACGDFQLMAREHWIELRGFAEFPTYSMSLDGLFSAAAECAGIREHVLEMPMCIYHLEHEKGSGWTPEGEALLRRRVAERGITWVDYRMFYIWAAQMAWLNRPLIFNGSDWGFGSTVLPETTRHAIGSRV